MTTEEIETQTQTRQELFIELYEEVFPGFATFVKKMSGTLDDAKDVFQDALLIYYEKTIQQQLVIQATDKAYLMGICKHLWYKKFNQKITEVDLDLTKTSLETEEEPLKISARLLRMIEHSGKKCLELLQSFYYEKKNMHEIASTFGFSGERSATTQKFKCLEKVRNEIKKRIMKKEDFYE
jgi:DNA-directed RNA polymerase specialized sigma24 family protein